MTIELVPLCSVDATLAAPLVVGNGPSGLRMIFEVETMRVAGDRLSGQIKGRAGADWFTVTGTMGTLDVRGLLETDDGALVFVQYLGRTDLSAGLGAPIYVAPRFEADGAYAWLNVIQAVGKGAVDGQNLHYDWFEVR